MAEQRERVAMLGVGMIGGGMAEAWLARGLEVAVWNRSPEKARAFAEKGARVCVSAADAARGAQRVHIALSDDAAVDGVLEQLFGADVDLSASVVVDHTTTATAGTRARAERLAARGIAFVHAPVFMSPAMAREAKGRMLLAGPAAVRDRVRDVLAKMTGEVMDLGDRVDAAAAYKLFGNIMIISMTAGLSDVFTLAAANGFSATDALSLFAKFDMNAMFSSRGAKMAVGEYLPASFEMSMARKDVRLMIESSEGAPLAGLPSIAARMDALLAQGHAALDMGALAIDAVPLKS
jgi:3-hydroxyisobutyrate dehydrogenase